MPPTKNPYQQNHPLPPERRHSELDDRGPLGAISLKVALLPALFFVSFSIAFIVVGAIYLEQCEIQPMIPVWLIIFGVFGVITSGWGAYEAHANEKSIMGPSMVTKVIGGILLLFFIAWFIAGNVWVYEAWGEDPDYAHDWFENGCSKSVFLLLFWSVIFLDVFVGLAIIGACVAAASSFNKGR